MAKRGDPRVLRFVVLWLRAFARWNQTQLARSCGAQQADVSRWEQGLEAPAEERLRRMAAAVRVPWFVVALLRRVFALALAIADRFTSPATADAFEGEIGEPVSLAIAHYLSEEAAGTEPLSPGEARREARTSLAELKRLPTARQHRLIEAAHLDCLRWEALVERTCLASEEEAARDAASAVELAELALFIAERWPGEASTGAQAAAWGFLGNARRVANDLEGADAAFARSKQLVKTATGDSLALLDFSYLHELEASLRRDQHRFPEALKLLDQAREASCGALAAGRLLLQKEHVLAVMGDYEGALAVLEEAKPLIEEADEPRLMFGLRFNSADNLVRLERYAEAAALLPGIHELIDEQANDLDRLRLLWLTAKVDAGQGREAEAVAALEQVQAEFTKRTLPYDAALSSLDLSMLWLKQGRTAEVRELAVGMAWIFEAQGIHREALAALTLFCESARQEAATVELARQTIADIEKVQRTAPPLRHDTGEGERS